MLQITSSAEHVFVLLLATGPGISGVCLIVAGAADAVPMAWSPQLRVSWDAVQA